MQMPYYAESSMISQFRKAVNMLGIMVVFDWSGWEEGWEMLRNKDFDFDSIDIPAKCKMITALIRSDRFSEGSLGAAFGSVVVLNILQSIERQLIRS